ncbi:MAG: type II toxin-antitoxin system RelE/ParE family toxin [Gammaproteobacteria bacterium]
MAEIVWTEPALAGLDAIADYIALDNRPAARRWVHRVFEHIAKLTDRPGMGSKPIELADGRYRQIIEPPCRVIHRHDIASGVVFIVHVVRSERLLPAPVEQKRETD